MEDLTSGEPLYRMAINLNVLNHLGLNLYSNIPALISEVVCIVGRDLSDWSTGRGWQESKNALATMNMRVVKYEKLIRDAYAGYNEYLQKRDDLGLIRGLLDELAADAVA